MIKRVQCRVISSVPLGKTTDTSRGPRSSNDKSDARPPNDRRVNLADKPDRIDEFVADNIRVKHTANSVSRIGWLNSIVVPIYDAPAGRIFDCYA
jgi:hypothetical protein